MNLAKLPITPYSDIESIEASYTDLNLENELKSSMVLFFFYLSLVDQLIPRLRQPYAASGFSLVIVE